MVGWYWKRGTEMGHVLRWVTWVQVERITSHYFSNIFL